MNITQNRMFIYKTNRINKMNKYSFIIAILSLIALNSINAQTGSIKGIIRNQFSNEPIPFATIYVEGTQLGTQSLDDGTFEITNIPPGFIKISVTSVGYESFKTDEIRISNATHTNLEISLTESNTTLNEVSVTVNKFTRKTETPLSVHRISVEDIEKSAGANRDIVKVIQSLPGVGGTVSFRNDLIVRGGGPSENRFYIDGIETPSINHFSTQGASGGPVSILNVDFIKSADYYSSAFPSGRGNALSSVFDFRLIEGNKDKPSVRASVGASELSLSLNTPVSENSSLLFSVRRSYLQFLFSQIGLPFLPTFNDATVRYKIKLNNKNELSILFIGAYDQFKLNMDAEQTEENRYILGYLPVNNQWSYTLGASHKYFMGNSVINTVLSRNHLNNSIYKYANNDESNPNNLLTDFQSNESENKLRSEFSSTLNGFNINAGALAEYSQYDTDSYNNLYINGLPTEISTTSLLNMVKYGAFGSMSKTMANEKLTLTVGVRADGANYSTQTKNLFKQLSPRLSGSYQLNNLFSLNFNVGRYYQLPSYTVLGYKDANNELANKRNEVKYIAVNHYVAGFEVNPNTNSKFTVETFFKQYSDYPFSVRDQVSMASKGGDFGVFGDEEVTPTSKGEAKGFEVLYRIKTEKKLNVSAAYTYVRSSFTDKNNQLIASSWDSRHIFTTTIGQSLKGNWDIGAKWRYVGGLPYTPWDIETSSYVQAWNVNNRGVLDYENFNSLRLASFHQLDFRVDKSFYYKNFMIGLYIDIQNLYNQVAEQPSNLVQVVDAGGNPIIKNPTAAIEDQQYELKELKNSAGTVLPTIGIIVEF